MGDQTAVAVRRYLHGEISLDEAAASVPIREAHSNLLEELPGLIFALVTLIYIVTSLMVLLR